MKTLENTAWYIPQLIPRESPGRETYFLEKSRFKVKNSSTATLTKKLHKSQMNSFVVYFPPRLWIGLLQYDFIPYLQLWGYSWGSMQITIFDSLLCGYCWLKTQTETLTNPGSSDEWVKTECTARNYMCVGTYAVFVCTNTCAMWICVPTLMSLRRNWARSEGPRGQHGRETTHIHTSNPISLFIKHST